MQVTRDGDTFEVQPLNDWWEFWQVRFAGTWEAGTKAVVDRHVERGVFVDIGAWVGPVSLWASRRGAHVIAAEPEPVSYSHLDANLRANRVSFHAKRVAISDHDGVARLGRGEVWGDSAASFSSNLDAIDVPCLTLESFLAAFDLGNVQLIKMDIEGAEGIVIPQAEPYLCRLGAPLCLSLHPQLWTRDPRPWLSRWTAEPIAADVVLYHPPERVSHAASSSVE